MVENLSTGFARSKKIKEAELHVCALKSLLETESNKI